MGYGGTLLNCLTELRQARILTNITSVLDVGAQETSAPSDYIRPFLEAFTCKEVHDEDVTDLIERQYTRHLWEYVGIRYTTFDIGAELDCVLFDLNHDTLPAPCANQFDLVTNAGTTEHVVNQVNSFKVIHELTRPGGYMIHDLPWVGLSTHGFFHYTPTFFSAL